MTTPTRWTTLIAAVPALLLSPLLLPACGDKDGGDDSGSVNSSNVCIDEDLGSSLEFDLASAESEGDDYQLSDCNGNEIGTDGEDYGWTWVAPAAGGYTFSTSGSDFDTVLAIHGSGCEGPLLACNDDLSFDNDASEVYIELEEAQEIVIVVDGYDAYETGTITLHVLQDL